MHSIWMTYYCWCCCCCVGLGGSGSGSSTGPMDDWNTKCSGYWHSVCRLAQLFEHFLMHIGFAQLNIMKFVTNSLNHNVTHIHTHSWACVRVCWLLASHYAAIWSSSHPSPPCERCIHGIDTHLIYVCARQPTDVSCPWRHHLKDGSRSIGNVHISVIEGDGRMHRIKFIKLHHQIIMIKCYFVCISESNAATPVTSSWIFQLFHPKHGWESKSGHWLNSKAKKHSPPDRPNMPLAFLRYCVVLQHRRHPAWGSNIGCRMFVCLVLQVTSRRHCLLVIQRNN